jgi:hypothetical protein
MFHFPTFPPTVLCVQTAVTGHDSSWVSPFGHPRITAWLSAPRGFSQIPTSFIGSYCQGIHRALLVACHDLLLMLLLIFLIKEDARVLYEVFKLLLAHYVDLCLSIYIDSSKT